MVVTLAPPARQTGRTNNRDCIDSALPCCSENVADTCSQGKNGGLPWEEFTIAKAAKKSKLGDYGTIQVTFFARGPPSALI